MEPKRRRLAAPEQQSDRPVEFRKPLPLSGEGVVSVNIQSSTMFTIRIQPATGEKADKELEQGGICRGRNKPKWSDLQS